MLKQHSFPKQKRLLNKADFTEVFNSAYKLSQGSILILCRNNNLAYARLGIILKKRNIKLAVARNKLKRITRESFRKKMLMGLDIIVMTRPGLDLKQLDKFKVDLERLWEKLINYQQSLLSS